MSRAWLAQALGAVALAVGALTFAACPDDGSPAGTGCISDDSCPTGTICNAGICATSCINDSFCGAGQICAQVNGQGVCITPTCSDSLPCAAGLECIQGQCQQPSTTLCSNDDECATGETCVAGSCEPTVVGSCDPACTGTDICDATTNACRPCEGAECPASDCTVDGCDPGFTCNTGTGLCEEDVVVSGVACGACTNSDECGGGGWKCIPVGGANICAPPCGTSDDCETGWTCFSSQCVPGGFSCDGCVSDGCDAGQACESNAGGLCQAAKASCDTCIYDWECGPDAGCHDVGSGAKVCVPRCSTDADCAANGAVCIIDEVSSYKVCSNAGCGTGTTCTPECSGATPHCNAASVCVACTNDTHCASGEECNLTTFQCEAPTGCQPPTPIFSPEEGKCVQCTEDSHCGGGTCNLATFTCDGDVCSTCVDPYPACALVGSDYYCVQCTTDAECGQGGTCNLQTYSCEGGTITVPDACTSDADCDPGVSGFQLYCDVGTGLCLDAAGGCDGVTAFCPNGNECISLIEALAGDFGGALPEIPGGTGDTIPGVCECTPDIEIIPGFGGPSADCPDGWNCGPGLFALMLQLLGGGGTGLEGKYSCSEDSGLPFP